MRQLDLMSFSRVVYTAGKVFDGLATGRIDTENFLCSGSTDGIASRPDLALLEDLRDVANFVITHAGEQVTGDDVCQINARITRSGPLHPGQFRRSEQTIGVQTPFGRHEPPALAPGGFASLVASAQSSDDPVDAAVNLFIDVARAQPFEDGNKRTALFAANGVLLSRDAGVLLATPFSEVDPTVADTFTRLLAQAYLSGENSDVAAHLKQHGVHDLA